MHCTMNTLLGCRGSAVRVVLYYNKIIHPVWGGVSPEGRVEEGGEVPHVRGEEGARGGMLHV